MIYVFDTNSLSNVLNHYYRDEFPSFWHKLDEAIRHQWVLSVRECERELKERFSDEQIKPLVAHNADFFAYPMTRELGFITQIYSIPHFRYNLERKKLLSGGCFADPFVVAKAWALGGVVVTEETFKDHAAKIPNMCQHFVIPYMSLQQFMHAEKWTF